MVPQMPAMPPEVIAQLAGGGGLPPGAMGGAPPPDAGPEQPDPLEALQQVIEDTHRLIAVLPDPKHTKIASTCLTNFAGIQADLMGQSGGGGGQSASY